MIVAARPPDRLCIRMILTIVCGWVVAVDEALAWVGKHFLRPRSGAAIDRARYLTY